MISAQGRRQQSVWYVAAGFNLPAGSEAYLLHYATEIRRHGFAPRIVVFDELPSPPHRYLVALRERGIPIESLYEQCGRRARLRALVKYPWLRLREHTLPFAKVAYYERKMCAVRLLANKIRHERPELLHVKGRIVYEAFRVFPGRRTLYQHALVGSVDGSWDAHELEAFRTFATRVCRVAVQATPIAETFKTEFGVEREMDIVYTMAPDELPAPRRGELLEGGTAGLRRGRDLRFGLLSRLEAEKGIAFLLDALRVYRDRCGRVDFTFAGAGAMEETIKSFAAEHGLEGVRVIPVTSPVDALNDVDVFVHPSLNEAMPVAMVEALMCGKPTIATGVGGCPELVRDGVEGRIVPPGNAAAIAEAMAWFAERSEEEMTAFRRRARLRYEEVCRPEVVGGQVAALYREIIGSGPDLQSGRES